MESKRAFEKKMASCSRRIKSHFVNTIFFDLDNTLIQTRKGDKLACDKNPDKMGEIPAAVKKCVAVLRNAEGDTEKFAALFMVTKLVKGKDCNPTSKKALFEAIGFPFLKKLLLTPDVPIDCPPLVYKSVALSILSCFCSEPLIATHQEMLNNIPVFIDVIHKAEESDDDEQLMVISESYECLKHISSYPEGQEAFLKAGGAAKMIEFYVEQNFQCDEALNILVLLVGCQGPTAWGSDPKPFHKIVSKISLDFKAEQGERKFEICLVLHTLLFNCPKEFIDSTTDEEIWPSSVFKGITDILTSKIGKAQRDPALKLASIVVELLGVEWCLSDEERPKQFFLLLVQLCSVEVRMQLEDRSLKQIMGNADLVMACFTIMEMSISFVASEGKIDLEEREKQSMYTALKGAFNAVISLLGKLSKELPDGGSGTERIFVCALVRVLAAWLAQETTANRNAVIAMLPYILSVANETFRAARARRLASKSGNIEPEGDDSWGKVDVLRLFLPAMCHLAVDEKARAILFMTEQDEVLYECISYHWSIVNYKRPPVPKSERLKVRAADLGPDAKTLAEMADSKVAMVSACNIFMNFIALEGKLVEESALFDKLLKFVMEALPETKPAPENLVLQGHLAVLGLMLLKQKSGRVRKNDFSICRYVQSVIRFLWDAYVIDEGRETTISTGSIVVSMTYKERWMELHELWFLGMQTMSSLLSQLPWISEFAVETGWLEGTAIMLRKVRVGALPHNVRAAYEDFLCQMVIANKDVAEVLKKNDILTTCRTHRLMELGKKLFESHVKGVSFKCRNLIWTKLVDILHEDYGMPHQFAVEATLTFLENFRLCTENPEMSLNEWRRLLWAQSLGEKYKSIAAEVCQQWLQLRYECLALTSEVKTLLRLLRRRHFHLGLITNGPSRAQWEKVNRLDLARFFDVILVSGDLPWEKPSEEIFLEACRLLHVPPSACLMVGDKLETDILGGKEAALAATVWVTPPKCPGLGLNNHPKPDFVLDKVTDILRLLPASANWTEEKHQPPPYSGRRLSFPTQPDFEECNSNFSNASDGS
ncbi:hypothetical protein J437_LFUL004269 [Ladona fulva]|uniref:Neurochondrin n=1 Tax=Ladona fulva TaxID=123851 RepID=A0A8K0KD69_LADFU|nr:hypothetical protein J437_LFUL004269 [Ladona fulva]